jgi:WD40 repeat protein
MEGVVTDWDARSQQLTGQSAVHTRPVSSLCFSPCGQRLASASWDRQVCLRGSERERVTFTAHEDIICGCRFTPDGTLLLTWSNDRTLRLWDVNRHKEVAILREHSDRVACADVSPDGTLAASGSRNGDLVLWDFATRSKLHALNLRGEIRASMFSLDGSSLIIVEASGNVQLLSVPELQPQVELAMQQPAQCAALSPRGDQLAIGGADGVLRLLAVEGLEARPLVVTATQGVRRTASRLQRLFGSFTETAVYSSVCPCCRNPVEILRQLPTDPTPCPHCHRPLRFSRQALLGEHSPC